MEIIQEFVRGHILVSTKSEFRHEGVTLTMDGNSTLQISLKNAGLIESFVNSSKTSSLLNHATEICKPGKIPAGQTQIPFDIPLTTKGNKVLYETYHGLYITVQYTLRCDIKRSLLAKDLVKAMEFIVEYRPGIGEKAITQRVDFEIQPETLKNVKDHTRIPKFYIRGHLDSSQWKISNPLTGELTVCECEKGISSIELQLVRVETSGSAEGFSREVSEIQNIQIGDGDVCRGVSIPVFMVLPRLFTCPTTFTANFKIEFELNIVIIFNNNHLIMETFPIKLTRH
ncbi:vacuolar protein sorting-associated protein 26C isoform X2 [Oratosquilla oratoria]|uniref:vacuolar protein sorting-associated protein 26C isoform X2 n=1 Tax=Oratosquilla oratoria TaxID=337810 RepID=UPI003F76E24B